MLSTLVLWLLRRYRVMIWIICFFSGLFKNKSIKSYTLLKYFLLEGERKKLKILKMKQ
jgi:hypothetical protein